MLSETRYSSLADHILSAVFAFVIFLVFASDQLFMTLEFAYSTTSSPVEAVSPPSRHSGPIVSLQFSSDGTPMWIVSGRWKIDVNYDTTGEMPLSIKNLNVSLVMVSVDGTTTHRYKLSNLEQNSLSYDNATNTSTLRGTLKLTLEGKSIDQLDTSLKIINKKIIVISLDSSKTNSYFGETPIYGLDR